MMIAVIGSGGKTSLIHKAAQNYLEMGKTVFVTTTTHMYREEGTLVDPTMEEVTRTLTEKGYCMAGSSTADGNTEKITALAPGMLRQIDRMVDITLIEADGSRHMPLKWPAFHEPVIPDGVDEIWLVVGLPGIGHRAQDVVHRYELAGFLPDQPVTEEELYRLVHDGYLKKIWKHCPSAGVQIFYIV